MATFHISYLFMMFLAYSFIGWLWETCYCSIKHGHFINRGFLRGPLCPVYGFGGLLIMYLLEPWAHTWLPLFFASMVIVSILEYFTGWLLETLFHTRWWDYSKERFNLHGRIYLGGAICFGIMGTVITHFVHPWLEAKILSIPLQTARLVAWILFAVFLVDFLTTIRGLVDFTIYQSKLKEFTEILKHPEGIQEDVKQHILNRLGELNKKHQNMTRFIKKFPSMHSKEFHAGIEELKQRVQQEREQLKNRKSLKRQD